MIGYKIFNPRWQAICGKGGRTHPYQYEMGQTYEENEAPKVRHTGFHFCKDLMRCFDFYSIDVHNRIALIDAIGDIDEADGIYATNKMVVLKEIPWRDVLKEVHL